MLGAPSTSSGAKFWAWKFETSVQVDFPCEAADLAPAPRIESAKQIICDYLLRHVEIIKIKSMVAQFESSAILQATNTVFVTGYVQLGGAERAKAMAKKVPQCAWTIMSGGLGSEYRGAMENSDPRWITLNVIGMGVLKRGSKALGCDNATKAGEVGDPRASVPLPPPTPLGKIAVIGSSSIRNPA